MAPGTCLSACSAGYFNTKAFPYTSLSSPLPVELLSLRAADSPSEHLLAILPYAISVLVLSPIVRKYTSRESSALRNRLGSWPEPCSTASIFALFHPSANVLSDGTCKYPSLSSPAHSSPPVHSTRARARSTLLSPRTHWQSLPSFSRSQCTVLVGALWVLWDHAERGLSLAAELKVGHALENL